MDVATAKRPLWKAASTETSCRRLLMNGVGYAILRTTSRGSQHFSRTRDEKGQRRPDALGKD